MAAAALAAGCGDDGGPCGPGDAGASGLMADIGDLRVLGYGAFNSSPNNDCTPPEGGPTSLTLDGTQVGQPNFHMTFCIPRPDEIPSGDPVDITDEQLIEVIDINGQVDAGCVLTLDRARAATGTITFGGYCAGGLAEEGYSITLDATVPGTVVCGGNDNESVDIDLSGTVAVEALSI